MTLLAEGFTDTARFRAYGPRHIDGIAERFGVPAEIRETIRAIATVLPFRVNEYVLSDLVDWQRELLVGFGCNLDWPVVSAEVLNRADV